MSGYEKRILYFDEIENGRKVKNAGFTKLILQGEQCRLSVNINGLHKTDTIQCDLILLGDEKEVTLNRIDLRQGRCVYSCLLTREQMGSKGIRMEDAYGVCVRLSEQRLLRAAWREKRAEKPSVEKRIEVYEAAGEEETAKMYEMPQEQKTAEGSGMTEKDRAPEIYEIIEERREPQIYVISEKRKEPEMYEMPEVQEVLAGQNESGMRKMSENQGISKTREVSAEEEGAETCQLPELPEVREISEILETPAALEEPVMSGTPVIPETPAIPETPVMPEPPIIPETSAIPETPATPKTLTASEASKPHKMPEISAIPERSELTGTSSKRISDDKWQQLECIFPRIHPFGDKREYLSIAPKDFIILTREYQSLANNSFLLHGFYNYHHIILGKIPIKGKERFFLGVPGVFYEREKAVAIMFGFESFECAKEPAQTGTFGYYMKRVEI